MERKGFPVPRPKFLSQESTQSAAQPGIGRAPSYTESDSRGPSLTAFRALLAELFEGGGVGFEVGVVDLPVEVDDLFQFPDRLVEVTARPVDHRDVVTG